MNALKCLLACLLLLASQLASSHHASHELMAEPHFISANGNGSLLDGIVASLVEDEHGFLWAGTAADLVRYDGYRFKSYPLNIGNGNERRSARFMRALLASGDGFLWAGSDLEGLARFDIQNEQWTHYQHDQDRPDSIRPGTVQRLAHDREGNIWIGLMGSLDHFDRKTGRFTHYTTEDGLPSNRVSALLVTRRGELWVGTWGGLALRDAASGRFRRVSEAFTHSVIDALAEDASGMIWIGLRDGQVWRHDPRTGEMHAVDPAPGSVAVPVLTIKAVEHEVWIGRSTNIEVRDLDGHLQQTFSRNLNHPWSLGGTNFQALLRDRHGTTWVGSYGGGLQYLTPTDRGLWVRRQEDEPTRTFMGMDVRSILQLKDGKIWLGTLDRGIMVLDRGLKLVATIPPQYGDLSLVTALAQAANGDVWAGNDVGQLFRFNEQRKLLSVLSTEKRRVRRLFTGKDGVLWVATSDGLLRLAPGARTLDRVLLDDGKPLGGIVNAMTEDGEGRLWVGAESGVYRLSASGVLVPAARSEAIPRTSVLGMLLDRGQALWIDTNAGLFRRSPEGQVKLVGTSHGQLARSIGANLLEDHEGRVWTHRGVYDPRTDFFTEFSRADGVDIGIGWFRSYAKLDGQRMLFGGNSGLLVVEPERYQRWSIRPEVVPTALRIDGLEQQLHQLRHGLVLRADQRDFAIEFAALDLTAPDRNRYRYRLHGYDDHWIAAEASLRVARYTNLPPGQYVLEVQGSNRLGDWSDQILRIPVHMMPAWWQTWWGHGLFALLGVVVFFSLLQWRTHALQRSQARLELRVQERTAELEAMSAALKESSLTDPLTGLHNRRFLSQHIESDIALALRHHNASGKGGGEALVFMMVDIDHFKQINDDHGHSAGDAVLMQMAYRLRKVFRDSDHIVRWGGEEFLVVIREGTRAQANELAARLCTVIAQEAFVLPDGKSIDKTCTIGFACYPLSDACPQAVDWAGVVDLADGALYEGKRRGRNGWIGVLGASPDIDAEALKNLVRQPPSTWLADPALQIVSGQNMP